MIRLLLRPPHFECDTPAEAAKLARIIRVSSDRPMIEVADAGSSKTKRCAKCKAHFSTVAPKDRASSLCPGCRPKPARRKAAAAHPSSGVRLPGRCLAEKPAARPVAVTTPKPEPGPAHFEMVTCRARNCGASVPEFESIDGLCLECAPMARRNAS